MSEIWLIIFRIAFILIFILALIPVLVLLERKISAFIQDRPGPNRANIAGIRLGGLIQAMADALKLAIKEDFTPAAIRSKALFTIAPMVLFLMSTLTIAVIPFSEYFSIDGVRYLMQAIPFDGGMLWYLGFASLSIYGIMLAGWSSNNKYSLLGSLRAASGAISYEIPLGLAVVSMIITYNSISLNDFVIAQQGSFFLGLPAWGIFLQPLAAIIFIICAFAETNRAPFDLAEGESEIVAGYHLEYSAMSFAMFFMAEYIAMTAMSALIVTIFFGGYSLPYLSQADLAANYEIVLLSIAGVATIFGLLFIWWVSKNNVTRYKTDQDHRKKENIIYYALTALIVAIIDIICLYFYGNLGEFGAEIVATAVNLMVFAIKTFIVLLVFIWVRWTLPRFRYDQIQRLGWEKLMPLAILNIIITALAVVYVS